MKEERRRKGNERRKEDYVRKRRITPKDGRRRDEHYVREEIIRNKEVWQKRKERGMNRGTNRKKCERE